MNVDVRRTEEKTKARGAGISLFRTAKTPTTKPFENHLPASNADLLVDLCLPFDQVCLLKSRKMSVFTFAVHVRRRSTSLILHEVGKQLQLTDFKSSQFIVMPVTGQFFHILLR